MKKKKKDSKNFSQFVDCESLGQVAKRVVLREGRETFRMTRHQELTEIRNGRVCHCVVWGLGTMKFFKEHLTDHSLGWSKFWGRLL